MIGIPVGLAIANMGEWLIHKHILHGRGKKRGTFWSFHFHEHHRNARQNGFVDGDYQRSLLGWHAQSKEALGVAALMVAHAPLLPLAPFYTATIWYCGARYYYVHKRSHQDPQWARDNVPWHYDHHMGPDQDANWCVTRPWFDHVMGTRIPYAGTERERKDEERRKKARTAKLAA